jgi:uncharacterized membrane protein YkvA (DUF1232 family)
MRVGKHGQQDCTPPGGWPAGAARVGCGLGWVGRGVRVTTLLVGLASALAAAFIILLVAAAVAAPRDMPATEVLRVYPDVLRLLIRLSRDPRVCRPVRWRLLIAVAYNVQPINLIPDFIPVVGMLDNVVVTAWAVRSAVRRSGPEVVFSLWRGSPAGFALLCRLCRISAQPQPAEFAAGPPAGRPVLADDLAQRDEAA